MKNKNTKKRRLFFVYPYVFGMMVFAYILMLATVSLCIYWTVEPFLPNVMDILQDKNSFEVLCLLIIVLVLCFAALPLDFGFTGCMRIGVNGLRFYAFLRRSVQIDYDEIKYIGIDSCAVSGKRQFWIYFSTDPLPVKYRGKVNRLPFKKGLARIAYSKNVYTALLAALPHNLSAKLEKAITVIRVYAGKEYEDA